jgi:o-succinylbenzoate---CoA ligase
MNQLCPIAKHAGSDKIALISDEEEWSYRDLHRRIQKLCPHLIEQPFLCGKKWDSILTLFGLLRLKKIAFPLNGKLPEAQLKKFLNCPLPDDFCGTLLLTSGSSGAPKIACHSLENHYFSAVGSNAIIPLSSNDRWLLSLPLYHVGGLQILFRSFLASSTVVISDRPLIETLLDKKITHLSLVPTQLYRILKEDSEVLKKLASQLKCILLGGAPIGTDLYERALSLGLNVFPTYGMTEMTSQICTDTALSMPLSFGHPLPFREVNIAEDGEILVKGKTLFQGYWEKDAPHLNLGEQGWFATGDLGSFRPDGRLNFLGRKDNLFISGGENIQPEEIEGCLTKLPGVIQAIVVPLQDEEFGARPAAFILHEDKAFRIDILKDLLKEHLPSYKIPIRIYSLLETPLKPDRRQLRALAASLEEKK